MGGVHSQKEALQFHTKTLWGQIRIKVVLNHNDDPPGKFKVTADLRGYICRTKCMHRMDLVFTMKMSKSV